MRTGRPRSFDRDAALDAAVAVFWEHGYDVTSISMLTKALGIGGPSIYAAFGDKESLFLEALDTYLETYASFLHTTLAEETEARAAVRRLLHEAAASYTRPDRPPGCLLASATTNSAPQSAHIAARLREVRAAGLAALEEKFAGAIQSGELPAAVDTHAAAVFYAAVVQGMSAQARDGATRTELEQIAEAALRAWPSASRQ